MRLLKKLAIKFITMVVTVVLLGSLLRYAKPYIMKSAGMPEGMPGVEGLQLPNFSSEESDLMATIFKSALRLFSGSAKRDELAGELSDKLYAGRGNSATMSELGIQLEKPGAKPSDPTGLAKPGADSFASAGEANPANSRPGARVPARSAQAGDPPEKGVPNPLRDALVGRIVEKAKANPELTLIPFVLFGMLVVHLFRRRRSPEDDFALPDLSKLIPSEDDAYEMTHAVHSLPAEDFELLVGLIYQRQGYRVSMPAGLSGGRGGDFMVLKKSEKLLVQCKKSSPNHKVHVDRVRELYDAAVAASVTRGVYVATCGFSWDARNFAKTKGVTLINAKTLDTLLDGARQNPEEDFLAVSEWAPKFMSKVKLTPPLCPACEAPMDEVSTSSGSVWVCSERPECRGRRSARKSHKPKPTAASDAETTAASNATKEAAKVPSKTGSNIAKKAVSKAPPKPVSKAKPKPTPNSTSKAESETTPIVVSKATPKELSKAVLEAVSKATPKELSKAVLEAVSKATPKELSKAVLEAVSNAASTVTAKKWNRPAKPPVPEEWNPDEPRGGRARRVCPSSSGRRSLSGKR